MSTSPETPAKLPPPAGFGKLASAIWLSPREVGEAVAARTPWVAMFIAVGFIVLILVGGTWMCREPLLADTLEIVHKQMAKNPNMPADAVEHADMFLKSGIGRGLLVGQQVLIPLVGFPLIALALYLGQLLMGGRAGFGQALAVTVFAGLISFGAGWLVRCVLVVAKGSFIDVSTGLGVLVDAPMNDPLRAVLDLLDLFVVWAVISAGVALAIPARLSRGVCIGVSFAVYAILGGVGVAYKVFSLK